MATDSKLDLVESLCALGFRVAREPLAAFLTHAHKSRLSPTETLEQLTTLERRAREATKPRSSHQDGLAGLGQTYRPL